jgi:hypothetical protein
MKIIVLVFFLSSIVNFGTAQIENEVEIDPSNEVRKMKIIDIIGENPMLVEFSVKRSGISGYCSLGERIEDDGYLQNHWRDTHMKNFKLENSHCDSIEIKSIPVAALKRNLQDGLRRLNHIRIKTKENISLEVIKIASKRICLMRKALFLLAVQH